MASGASLWALFADAAAVVEVWLRGDGSPLARAAAAKRRSTGANTLAARDASSATSTIDPERGAREIRGRARGEEYKVSPPPSPPFSACSPARASFLVSLCLLLLRPLVLL